MYVIIGFVTFAINCFEKLTVLIRSLGSGMVTACILHYLLHAVLAVHAGSTLQLHKWKIRAQLAAAAAADLLLTAGFS